MRIIMIKGFSKTGKTTTVTSLVKELRARGYTVGTVKDIHYEGFQADREGTDTFRHAEAGARRVTARGQKQTAVITDRQMTIHEILKYYKEDFVILEGDSGLSCPTIITGRTVEDVEQRMCPEAIAVSGIIAAERSADGDTPAGAACSEEDASGTALQKVNARDGRHTLMGLPLIDGVGSVKVLADLIERKTEDMKENFDVELTIDGEDIWMVPFVKETLKNVVIGAVKALDGYEEGKEIVIKIREEKNRS